MINKILCVFLMCFISIQATYHQGNVLRPIEIYKVPVEQKYPEVRELLMYIPTEQRDSFVTILKDFGDKRNFDWRFTLLLMHNESRLNNQAKAGSYAGLIMFGKEVRRSFNLTIDDILKMNHIQQANLAVKVWEKNEAMGEKYKIKDFISLHLATFMPAWIPYSGNPYPASALVKKSNHPFVDKNGNITKESLLDFYRKQSSHYKELKYFIGKI